MAANVESQRLISLSLGKIAQSRSQKGGINLHKNLLVATVLHKARTACMMEYQSLQRQRQLEFQQRQQQQKDAAALEFEAKQEQARSAALSLAAFNTSQPPQQQSVIPTCVREMEEQDLACDSEPRGDAPASDPITHGSDVNLGQSSEPAALPSDTSATSAAPKLGHTEGLVSLEIAASHDSCDKENFPPHCVTVDLESGSEEDLEVDFEEENAAQVVPQSSVLPTPVDHLIAATHLAEDAAGLSSKKHQVSAAPTCNVLKRQRENWGTSSHEQECPPATKKARVVATPSVCRRDSCSARGLNSAPAAEVDQHSSCSSESNQISNLVSIFNSGFSGLCAVSSLNTSSSSSSNEELSSSLSSCDMSAQYSQPDSSLSISSSLSCSSSMGRMDALPSALGLVLSV
ncbi:hypothetical protein RRG08_053441 [Elysia crispata]|uniref:Uncharacterized protein n=1 Tax=Elysia crispata TaxID=231223 RepID=A0AAE1DF68_9GAST|nr:hypothetical protein RRG08_053441 [Elysia crispata]